jgi:hypothetical protein
MAAYLELENADSANNTKNAAGHDRVGHQNPNQEGEYKIKTKSQTEIKVRVKHDHGGKARGRDPSDWIRAVNLEILKAV